MSIGCKWLGCKIRYPILFVCLLVAWLLGSIEAAANVLALPCLTLPLALVLIRGAIVQ